MEAAIADDPSAFPAIKQTSGFRNARWGRGSSGKRGGIRVIFYFYAAGDTVFFALAYAKNETENLSHDQEKQLKALVKEIEEAGAR